jgi:hypothetical protein
VSLWNLRLRALLQQQFVVVAVALVVLGVVGGFATYTAHVAPGTTTEDRVVSTWETTGQFDHSATVVEENPVFPVGSELTDRSVYFARLAPVLDGQYVFGYRTVTGGGGELTAEIDLALVTRGSEGGTAEEGGDVLWETRQPLGETRRATLGPGESATVPFSVNVTAVEERRDRIADQLGTSTGTIRTIVQASVNVTGTVNGERVVDSRSHTLSLTLETDSYRVGSVAEPTHRTEITQPVTVPREYGPLRTVGGPVLVFVSVVGLVALSVGRSQERLTLTGAEREWLAYRDDRSAFDEWITEFSVPQEVFDRPRAEAASLGDLVDFAIDTDSGVVESPDGSQYLVVNDEFLYTYATPEPPETVERQSAGSRTGTDPALDVGTDAEAGDDLAEGPDSDADSDTGWTGTAFSRPDMAALDLDPDGSNGGSGTEDVTDDVETGDGAETGSPAADDSEPKTD